VIWARLRVQLESNIEAGLDTITVFDPRSQSKRQVCSPRRQKAGLTHADLAVMVCMTRGVVS
jgi:hypothetical protein